MAAFSTYSNPPWKVRLTGPDPPDLNTPTGERWPFSASMTEISSLPASTANRREPSGVRISEPCVPSANARMLPVPPMAVTPWRVRVPSAARAKTVIEFGPTRSLFKT